MKSGNKLDKNYKNRKIIRIVAFGSLIIASTASAVTATFAFNATSSILRTEEISVSTVSPAKIELGIKNELGNIDYYDNLTNEILKKSFAGSYNQDLEDLETPLHRGFYPVTSAFKDEWWNDSFDFEKDLPQFTSSYIDTSFVSSYQEETPSYFPGFDRDTDHFLTMDLYIRELKDNTFPVNFYLSDETFVKADENNNALNLSKLKNKNKEKYANLTVDDLNSIVNSLRISILVDNKYYIIDPTKTENSELTVLSGYLDIDRTRGNRGYVDTYPANFRNGAYSDCAALYGEWKIDGMTPNEYLDKTGIDPMTKLVFTDPLLTDEEYTDNEQGLYFKAGTRKLDYQASEANGVEFVKEETYSFDDLTYRIGENEIPLFHLEPGASAKRLIISYYIEGWDMDNINSSEFASFISQFKITGKYDRSGYQL